MTNVWRGDRQPQLIEGKVSHSQEEEDVDEFANEINVIRYEPRPINAPARGVASSPRLTEDAFHHHFEALHKEIQRESDRRDLRERQQALALQQLDQDMRERARTQEDHIRQLLGVREQALQEKEDMLKDQMALQQERVALLDTNRTLKKGQRWQNCLLVLVTVAILLQFPGIVLPKVATPADAIYGRTAPPAVPGTCAASQEEAFAAQESLEGYRLCLGDYLDAIHLDHAIREIHMTACSGDIDKMVSLLQGEAKDQINIKDKFDHTPLHYATGAGRTEMTKYLLSQGANKEAKNYRNWTPIHHAAYHGHPLDAEELLKAGADANAQANDGNTPLGLVLDRQDLPYRGREATINVLKKHGGQARR